MSKELSRKSVPARRPYRLGRNMMTFPRELRDAIPDLPTCVGRALELAAMDGKSSDTTLFGPCVHLMLTVRETGRLKGEFPIRIDLHADAARALAATLNQLAGELATEEA